MKHRFDNLISPVDNERGFTLILAIILLMLLAILGVTAVNTSTTETLISTAEEVKRSTFNAAESGVEHASAMLLSRFTVANQNVMQLIVSGGASAQPTWTFALDGSSGVSAASAALQAPGSSWLTRFNSGASWIVDAAFGNGYSYSVRVWNNEEPDADPAIPGRVDKDGLIVVGALATGPNNAVAASESLLRGTISSVAPSGGYTAQAGAGAGKNYNATDVNAISTANLGLLGTNANLK